MTCGALCDQRSTCSAYSLGALAARGEHVRAIALGERRRDVVLSGERVGRAQPDLRAAGDQRTHEVRRLRRHVQAGRDPHAFERALAREALAHLRQHGHLRSAHSIRARPRRRSARLSGHARTVPRLAARRSRS